MSKEWREIFNRNTFVSPAKERVASTISDTQPYLIQIKAIELTKVVPTAQYQVRVCFYDAKYRCFFGHPWKSRWILPPPHDNTLLMDERVYFHTGLSDGSIFVLMEIAMKKREEEYGEEDGLVGWSLIRFHQPNRTLTDASAASPPQTWTSELCSGSPKLLFFLKEPVDSSTKLLTNRGNVHFTLQTHRLLLRAVDFLPDNTLVGDSDLIPGLERHDRGVLMSPVPKAPAMGYVDEVTIQLGPHAEGMEEELCSLANRERLFRENKMADNDKEAKMIVMERRIRIGVHNGWTFSHEPYVFHLSTDTPSGTHSLRRKGPGKGHARDLSGDKRNPSNVLVLRNRVELKELVADPGIAVIFVLDFVVGLQTNMPDAPSESVVVCWGGWSPFVSPLSSPTEMSVPLFGGPSQNPDRVLCFKNLYRVLTSRSGTPTPTTLPHISTHFNFYLKSHMPESPRPASSTVDGSSISVPKPRPHSEKDWEQEHRHPLPPALLPTLPSPPPPKEVPLEEMDEAPPLPPPKPPPRKDRLPLQEQLSNTTPPVVPGPMSQDWGRVVEGAMGEREARGYPGQMKQLLHPPIHPQVYSLLNQYPSIGNISRNTYSILSSAGFRKVEDRHGDSPDLVDMTSPSSRPPNIPRELDDPLGCNEIILQFLALAPIPGSESSAVNTLPHNIFFTFQFYRFPPVNTERLLVSQPDADRISTKPRILKRIDCMGKLVTNEPGYQVKFMLDPKYLRPGEQRAFLQYLLHHSLHLDIWDADSLMLLGSAALPLQGLFRRGKEAVESWAQLSVVTTELRSVGVPQDMEDSLSVVLRALLILKVANVGYPHTGPSSIFDPNRLSRNSAVVSHRLEKHGKGTEGVRVRASPFQTPLQLQLPGAQDQTQEENLSEERRRKLTRLNNLRQIERYASLRITRDGKEALSRELESLRSLRQEHKPKLLQNAILESITTIHRVYPSFGSCEFMEFLLQNPYTEAISVSVEISHPEMKLITNAKEWSFYKRKYSLSTPLESSLFDSRDSSSENAENEWKSSQNNNNNPQLFLKPKEALYIPFKYQTFDILTQPFGSKPTNPDRQEKPPVRTVLLEETTVKTLFRRVDTGSVVSVLVVGVEPQPLVLHHTLRFYHPQHSFFNKILRPHSLSGLQRPLQGIHCSDPTVIAELRSDRNSQAQDVYVKAGCGESPQVKSFWIMLYADAYLSMPVQTWEVHLHACQKIDINGIQGHNSSIFLSLKGSDVNRMVRCFASSPSEVATDPPSSFLLQSGTVTEIRANYKPLVTGSRTLQITAVDTELGELVKSWLICSNVKSPAITKAYQLTIPVGNEVVNKKIAYRNRYGVQRVFRVGWNMEGIVGVREKQLLLNGGEEGNITVRFYPMTKPGNKEVMLFINDEDGNTEDTFLIKIVYAHF